MFLKLTVIFVLASELRSEDVSKNASTRSPENQRARLREALEGSYFDATRALIEEGVDIIAPFEDTKTPLHIASLRSKEKSKDVLKLLLAKKVPLETRHDGGETAFLLSFLCGYEDNAAILLEAGADVNAADNYGYTSLHWKVIEKNTEMVEWLMRKGASFYTVDDKGRNPFDVALFWKWADTVRILIEYGADISPPKYDPAKIFENYWESCFKISQSNFHNFDDYVVFVTNAFLAELPEDKHFHDDTLSIYAKNQVFALYRILKATYPEAKMRRMPSRLESAKNIIFDIYATRITEKTYFGTTPLEIISDVLFLSERMFWKIERLSFYSALISVNYNYADVNRAFTSHEMMQFIKDYIQ